MVKINLLNKRSIILIIVAIIAESIVTLNYYENNLSDKGFLICSSCVWIFLITVYIILKLKDKNKSKEINNNDAKILQKESS